MIHSALVHIIYHLYNIPSASQLYLYAEQSVHLTEHNGKMWTFFDFFFHSTLRVCTVQPILVYSKDDHHSEETWTWQVPLFATDTIRLILHSFLPSFFSFFFSPKVRRRARVIEVRLAVPWCRHTIAIEWNINITKERNTQIETAVYKKCCRTVEWGLAYPGRTRIFLKGEVSVDDRKRPWKVRTKFVHGIEWKKKKREYTQETKQTGRDETEKGKMAADSDEHCLQSELGIRILITSFKLRLIVISICSGLAEKRVL